MWTLRFFSCRSMVGHQILVLSMGVRVPPGEPLTTQVSPRYLAQEPSMPLVQTNLPEKSIGAIKAAAALRGQTVKAFVAEAAVNEAELALHCHKTAKQPGRMKR